MCPARGWTRAAGEARLRGVKRALLDMLFSRACEGCGAAMGEEAGSICWDCRTRTVPVQVPFCERCGDPVAGMVPGTYECAWCRKTAPSFDWARSAVRYDGLAKQCLRRLKYDAAFWVLDDLVGWLAALWRTCPASVRAADVVAPVPLHARRRRERGYNQSALLAEGLAKRVGVPFRDPLLKRTHSTDSQTRLTAAQRVHNVRGVFSVPRPGRAQGARIVLVDDVMTTGATANECARTLMAAGAASVMVVTVARG
jgi:ComF family protein